MLAFGTCGPARAMEAPHDGVSNMSTCRSGLGLGLVAVALTAAAGAQESPLSDIKKAAASAKVTLAQVIEIAQKEVADGKIVGIDFEWDKTPAYFEAKVLVDDSAGSAGVPARIKEVKIDAASGKVLGTADAKLDEDDEKELGEAKQALGGAKITLAAAVEAAVKEVKDGKPLEAELEMEDGKPSYTVALLQGDKVMEAEVDAATGKVTKTEEEPMPLALWNFEKAEVGKTPAGLMAKETHPSGKPGEWKVTADPQAPSGSNVLTLTTSAPDATFNVALFDKTSYKDLDLRVRVRGNTGKEDQGGGLIWRAKDENNYYICRINPLENNFRVYKVVDGKRSQLQSTEFKPDTGKWYQVRAVMVGDHITCYVDGKKYLDTKDDTFKDTGMIGLWTKADASSSFDNLAVFAPRADTHEEKGKVESKEKKGEKDEDDDDDE
jgi:uncharacterized membrane protein YkoI